MDIHEDFTTGVDGIGSARTVGYVHAPIYVDCMSQVGGKIGKVELNLEIVMNRAHMLLSSRRQSCSRVLLVMLLAVM